MKRSNPKNFACEVEDDVEVDSINVPCEKPMKREIDDVLETEVLNFGCERGVRGLNRRVRHQ